MLGEIWGSVANRNVFERLLSRAQTNVCSGESFHVRLTRLEDWSKFHPKHGHTFVASLTCMGRIFKGSGCAQVPALAIQKSISEAYERCLFHLNRFFHGSSNSNGFAAHPCLNQAVRNAVEELAERDTVLRHYYGQIPFVHISLETLPKQFETNRMLAHGYLITQVMLGTAGRTSTISLLAESLVQPGRPLISHGSGETAHKAYMRSHTELSRSVACAELLPWLAQSKDPKDEIFKHVTALWKASPTEIEWMNGEVWSWHKVEKSWRGLPMPVIAAANIQRLAQGDLHVVKATSPDFLKLEFKESPNLKLKRHFVA